MALYLAIVLVIALATAAAGFLGNVGQESRRARAPDATEA